MAALASDGVKLPPNTAVAISVATESRRADKILLFTVSSLGLDKTCTSKAVTREGLFHVHVLLVNYEKRSKFDIGAWVLSFNLFYRKNEELQNQKLLRGA